MVTYDANLDWLVPDDMDVYDVEKRKEIGAAKYLHRRCPISRACSTIC
jgi:hypothetical protein